MIIDTCRRIWWKRKSNHKLHTMFNYVAIKGFATCSHGACCVLRRGLQLAEVFFNLPNMIRPELRKTPQERSEQPHLLLQRDTIVKTSSSNIVITTIGVD